MSVPEMRFCLKCDYNLAGVPEPRCPECGRPFDPDKPATFRRSPMGQGVLRALRRPPGMWMILICIAVMAVTMWAARVSGWIHVLMLIAVLIWTVLALLFLVRLLSAIHHRLRMRRSGIRVSDNGHRVRWLIFPLFVTTTFVLVRLDIPFRFAFAVSRPSLEALLEEAANRPNSELGPRWIGLFHATSIISHPERTGVILMINQFAIDRGYGLVYRPPGTPGPVWAPPPRHLVGGWHVWHN